MRCNKRMRALDEEAVIRWCVPRPARCLVPAGDDAAVIIAAKGKSLVVATDHMVEDVHFVRALAPPVLLARKLVRVNVSDFAAMGGATPRWALLNLALPRKTPPAWVRNFVSGLRRELRRFHVVLVGGDTTASRGRIFLSLTLLGESDPGKWLLRSGARPGDRLFVSGTLGGSAAGLRALRRAGAFEKTRGAARRLAMRHLLPPDRLALGRALAKEKIASACMDISDGLAADLPRLCKASGVGAILDVRALPVDRAAARFALGGGEDYELLFTVPPAKIRRVHALGRRLKVSLTEIGRMARGRGVVVVGERGRAAPLDARQAFRHF